ncbi:hypothetical protein HID58_038032, partial [Brassica napus]
SENHERNRGAQTKEEANYSNRLRCAEPVFGITEIAPHIQLVSAATEKSYSRAPPGVLKVAERKKFEKLVVPKQKPTTSCLLPENLHAAGSEKHTRCRTHAPHLTHPFREWLDPSVLLRQLLLVSPPRSDLEALEILGLGYTSSISGLARLNWLFLRTDQREALRLQHHPQVTALEQLPLLHPWYPRSHLRRHYPRSRSTLHQNPVLYVTFPPGSHKPFWNDLENPEEARLDFPEELSQAEQTEFDFRGGAGAVATAASVKTVAIPETARSSYCSQYIQESRAENSWSFKEEIIIEGLSFVLSRRNRGTVDYIYGLDLSNDGLSGVIPSELEYSQNYEAMNLSHNFLSSSIPDIFSKLLDIETLIFLITCYIETYLFS